MKLEYIISNLSNDDLKNAFNEIVEWKNSGVLKFDGFVREVHKEFVEGAGIYDYPIHAMDTPFLFEIAKRHYEQYLVDFKWGDKILYKETECLFVSYAPANTKSAYVLLTGGIEPVKVRLEDLTS